MITTIILIKTEHAKINDVGNKLAELEGVSEVYSVTGRYNLIAVLRNKNLDDIDEIVTEKINGIEGIKKTETMIAYRLISKFDIAGMFDLGS
ncbi:MAG: Lrp/AsnC ligand binding domain-containing protein [Bacteroidales bacterium]|nr:Lrp/AsnC ligand binding domain-containing protein [Bacteroidales bacterium]MBN2817347.1 Lrp/AsnC ligand binding domain-containing protein [Bacteroidales bacterium]